MGDDVTAVDRWPRPTGHVRSARWPHGRYWWNGPWKLVNGAWRRCYRIPMMATPLGEWFVYGYALGPEVHA